MPAPRASGRTNRSSSQMPGRPRNVEYVGNQTASPTACPGGSVGSASTTLGTAPGPNSVAASSGSVHSISCVSRS